MTALAAVSQLEARIGVVEGSLAGVDLARAQAAIDDVSAEVLYIGDSTWTDETAPAVVVRVVLAAAKRIFLNPQGLASEQAGDYAWRAANAGGDILTPAESERVRDAAGVADVFTTRTALPDDHIVNLMRMDDAIYR